MRARVWSRQCRRHGIGSISSRSCGRPKTTRGTVRACVYDGKRSSAPSVGSHKLSRFILTLAGVGAVAGTLLDGIHSKDALQVYTKASFSVLGLNSSLVVPPLLAAFYVVAGSIAVAADMFVAAFLQLSATLYARGVDASSIGVVLAVLTVVHWRVLDATKQGLALAVLCAIAAPASEVLLNAWLGLWHYPRADLPGMVSWVPWCYAFYTTGLVNFARLLWFGAGPGSDADGTG